MKTDMHSWKGLKVVGHKTFLGEAKSYQASIDAMLGTGVKVEHGVNFEDISILTLEEESSCNTAHRKEADWKKEEKEGYESSDSHGDGDNDGNSVARGDQGSRNNRGGNNDKNKRSQSRKEASEHGGNNEDLGGCEKEEDKDEDEKDKEREDTDEEEEDQEEEEEEEEEEEDTPEGETGRKRKRTLPKKSQNNKRRGRKVCRRKGESQSEQESTEGR